MVLRGKLPLLYRRNYVLTMMIQHRFLIVKVHSVNFWAEQIIAKKRTVLLTMLFSYAELYAARRANKCKDRVRRA